MRLTRIDLIFSLALGVVLGFLVTHRTFASRTPGMPRRYSAPTLFIVVLSIFLGQPSAFLAGQEKPDERYRSPRATVRTLLTAITLARANPERIREAIACLDVEGLPAHQQGLAAVRATELEAILRVNDIDTSVLPDQIDDSTYVIADVRGQRIVLQRSQAGLWRFERETVAQIPRLYAEAQKQLQDRNREAAALKVSPDHASARATMRTLIDSYRRQDFVRILRCLDLSEIPNVARWEVGTQLANKLKQVFMRHRLPILQEIPDSNYSDPYIWLSQPDGVIELVRLPTGERSGEWVFSRETVRSLDKLFTAFEEKPYAPEIVALGTTGHLPTFRGETELWLRAQFPEWLRTSVVRMRHTTIQLYELLGYILVPALAYALYRLTTWFLAACVGWLLTRRAVSLTPDVLAQGVRATGALVGVAVLRWGLLVVGPDRTMLVPMLVVLNPLVWLVGVWAIFRLMDLVSAALEALWSGEQRRPDITHMLWPVASLALKIALLVGTVFHLMTLFAWDFTAVLTGLGIGGLAVALGAQDALKNFFGSFTLIADRPFVVDDSVKIGNEEPGVVESVGLRSTRVRTADDALLIVPNSNLTTMNITNLGRRRYRRYQTRLGIAYGTPPERLAAFRDGIREIIKGHAATRKDKFEVAIIDLAASSIEIVINTYFIVADRSEELTARDELILDILRLAAKLEVELAYPTQTIHVVGPSARPEPTPGEAGEGLAVKRETPE